MCLLPKYGLDSGLICCSQASSRTRRRRPSTWFGILSSLVSGAKRSFLLRFPSQVSTALQTVSTLLTVFVVDDMENQQAVRLARDADPDGERTIGKLGTRFQYRVTVSSKCCTGVLTKPDTLTQGAISSRKRWKDILQGRSHPLKRGYYCVRLPDDEERGRKITRSEADAVASQFFSSTPPWNEVMATDPSRFGIPNFISDISILLTAMIEKA